MVRTLSATLRRSFAQLTVIGGMLRNKDWLAPPAFIAATLFQSALLVGFVVSVAFDDVGHGADLAQLLGLLALLTSAYVGFTVFTGNDARRDVDHVQPATARDADLSIGLVGHHGFASHEAEQLARLKARVSHELRTPLNAMIGFSDMMHREVLGPVGNDRYREYAAHIRSSAERFQLATESSLAVTELLTSKRDRKRCLVELSDVVEQTLAQSRHLARTDDPPWDLSVEASLLVEADRSSLSDGMSHLWTAGRSLALAVTGNQKARCSVDCRKVDDCTIELTFAVRHMDIGTLVNDSELTPGAELTLFLARLSVEAAGGELSFDLTAEQTWLAIVRLPIASQPDFFPN